MLYEQPKAFVRHRRASMKTRAVPAAGIGCLGYIIKIAQAMSRYPACVLFAFICRTVVFWPDPQTRYSLRMQIDIKVVPGASKNEISGWLGRALKLRVRAAPENGKANRAVIALLAETLDVKPAHVRVVSGATRALKRVSVEGIDNAALARRLGAPETS